MKFIKSLSVGSVAGLVAISGAKAVDLPIEAKAVEYVRICSLYGAGFYYIPGTDTCIKLGGYLRVDTTFNGSVYNLPAYNGDLGQRNRYRDSFVSRSRMTMTVDTRTATEYGVVRTFGQGDFQFDSLGIGTQNPNNAVGSYLGINNSLLSTPGGGYVAVSIVALQFAGFTFGKSASAYATPWHGYPGNNSSFLLGGHDTVTGVNNIQYTAQFGNGVSGTIGLDDPTVFHRTAVGYSAIVPGAAAAGGGNSQNVLGSLGNAYAGIMAPTIVGNIRFDQAWGLFQISAAAHKVAGSYNQLNANRTPNALSEISGHPNSKWGGSVMAALQIKNLPTGTGDDIKFDASYARGHTKQVISTSGGSPSFAIFGDTSFPGAYQSIGFGYTSDAIYVPGGNLELTDSYGIRGAFNHNWDPYWSTSIFGSYTWVNYNGAAATEICARYPGIAVAGSGFSCNPDFSTSQLGSVTRWTPVKNLTFSAEVMWFHLNQKFSGAAILAAVAAPKPSTVYQFSDQNTVSLNVRVQRNF